MSTTLNRRQYTPDDLLSMPDAVAYELVNGRLVRRNMGTESSQIAARILILLGIFLRHHRLGAPFGSDTSYQCFPEDSRKIRRADVSFVRTERLPNGRAPKGHCPIAPDVAVEVVSPRDVGEELQEKVLEWLSVGVPLVWVVYPATRTVRIHRPRTAPAGSVTDLIESDVITGEEVLPGFSCTVAEFFDDPIA